MFDNLSNRIALGCMGLTGTWNPADMNAEREKRAIQAFEAAYEAGITFYDHADVYGGGSCEEVFAKCLAAVPGSREKILIATKGGIRLIQGFYDLSEKYLTECIERSLRRMNIEQIDLYQVHRPDPMAHPRETANALNAALKSGKVRYVGVSNYHPEQVRALQTFLDAPIVSNQVQLSLLRLEAFYEGWKMADDGGGGSSSTEMGDGTLDQCMALNMTPLAYSPLAKAKLSTGGADDARSQAVAAKLDAIALKYDATQTQIALAWLLSHPSGIVPLVGSANPEHIREAVGANTLRLTREEWYALWTASWGRKVP
jgi:predicted oxidoreductase